MTLSFLPEIPKIDPEKGPHLMAGAASPLWLMFGGAALAGATWWWWSSRWREAVNLEALMAPVLPPAAKPVVDPVTEAPVLTLAPVEVPEPVAEPAPMAEAGAEAVQDTLDAAEAATAQATETVKAAAAPVAEAVVEASKAADDLTQLVGIGPKLAASLAELGVSRFSEIAAWDAEDLTRFDKALNLKGRAERDAWVAQAKRLTNL